MIVKVQLPLNDPTAACLVYNETRAFEAFIEQSELPRHAARVMRKTPKAYFKAWHLGGEPSRLDIGDQVADQPW
jgi:hypothetical protein